MAATAQRRRAPTKLAVIPTKPRSRISDEALAWARQKPEKRSAPDRFDPRTLHPPAVTRGLPALAQDDAFSSYGWAQQMDGDFYGALALPYPELARLALRPEYRRISETFASEMTREWIEVKSTSDDDKTDEIKTINDALKHYKVQEHFRKLAEHDGFYGGAHLYIDTGDTDKPDELKTSIGNGRDKISSAKIKKGKLRGFKTIEAWCVYPRTYNASDPLSDDWYRPQIWGVMSREIHRTRLLTLVGREVSDLMKPLYSLRGLSLTQMVRSYVEKFRTDAKSVSDLVAAFSVMVLTTDLGTGLQLGGEELQRRLDFFINARDNRGVMAVMKGGGEDPGEKLENVSAPLGSLDKLQAQSQEHVCSASGLPLIKYTGLTPSGLNASSDGEIRSFYDTILSSQEYLFREPLTAVMGFIQLSEFGEIDPDITFDFISLWQLDDAAKAAIQKTKADVHDVYLTASVVSAEEVRNEIAADPEGPYAGLDLAASPPPEPPPDPGGITDPSDTDTERVDKAAEGQGGVTSGV